jgi:hypothetical protein
MSREKGTLDNAVVKRKNNIHAAADLYVQLICRGEFSDRKRPNYYGRREMEEL